MTDTKPSSFQNGSKAKAPILRALAGLPNDKPPFWFMRQAGRYLPEYRKLRKQARDFLDLCYTPELATEVTLQPLRRYPIDAAILFADILLVPDGLGQEVAFEEGRGPVLNPVTNVSGIDALSLDGLHEKMAPVYETVRRVRGSLAGDKVLIGFAGAPWTVATYMVEGGTSKDHLAVRRWAFGDPEGFNRLIELLIEATSQYLIRQIEAGVQVVQIFDTWAGALAEPGFRRWSMEPTARIVETVKAAHPEVPIIGFPRGAGSLYRDYIDATGVDGVSIDSAVSVSWAAANLQPRALVQGNLDPAALAEGGGKLLEEAGRIVAGLDQGRFIFNLGHGIVPSTPPEHVDQLCRFLDG